MRLIDTDVLIEMLRRGERIDGFISVITLLEFLRGVPEGEREIVKDLLVRSFPVIRLDNDVVEEYCRLYRDLRERGELLRDADLLIGATALARGLELVTLNVKRFKRLERYGLRVSPSPW